MKEDNIQKTKLKEIFTNFFINFFFLCSVIVFSYASVKYSLQFSNKSFSTLEKRILKILKSGEVDNKHSTCSLSNIISVIKKKSQIDSKTNLEEFYNLAITKWGRSSPFSLISSFSSSKRKEILKKFQKVPNEVLKPIPSSLYSNLISKYSNELEGYYYFGYRRNSFGWKYNNMFGIKNAETLYTIIREYKPSKVIEIGSGHSSYTVAKALEKNLNEHHIKVQQYCIEPYRSKVVSSIEDIILFENTIQNFNISFFKELKENDILFIDCSHVAAPYGDVIYLFLFVLPLLNDGVIVHIHDIDLPYDHYNTYTVYYRREWNEQYFLAAFLYGNEDWEILGKVSGSFYMRKKVKSIV